MTTDLDQLCINTIRFLSADAVQQANSGHPGMPMGMADVATVLFEKHLKFDAKNPDWQDRDRFILSAGGSREAEELYTAFRGRMPGPEALLKGRGLLA